MVQAVLEEKKQQPKSRAKLDLKKISRHYPVRVWDHEEVLYREGDTLGVELDNGEIFLDGYPILHPQFESDGITWHQKTTDHYTSGAIHFTPDGLSFAGVIYQGTDEHDAVAHYVSGAIPPTVYTSKVARQGKSPAGAANEEWDPGITVTIGYKYEDDGHLPLPVIGVGSLDDATSIVAITVNPKNENLQLEVLYDSAIAELGYGESPQWPASGKIEFSWDALSFTGWMKRYDPSTGQQTKLQYDWVGETHLPQSTPAPRKQAAQVVTGTPLDIKELITISPEGVQEMSFRMLIENMKWAMDDNWLKNFFGETKPVLTKERTDLINKNLDFYQQKFAPAYLGWGFCNMSGPGAPKNPLTEAQKFKLRYYLYNGMGREEGYNIQSNGIFLEAFIASSPRLRDYINDGGEKWARELYNAITTSPQINLMMNRIITGEGVALLNRYATLLAALQPSGELALEYNKMFTIRSLTHISDQADLNDKEQIMSWLPDVIQKFIDLYIVAPENPTKEELIRWQMAQDLQTAKEQAGHMAVLAGALADAMLAVSDTNLFNRMFKAQQTFAERFPKLAKAGKFLTVAAWAGGLYNAIVGFQDWENLEDRDKAEIILTTVGLFGNLILAVPDILSAALVPLQAISRARNYIALGESSTRIQRALEKIFGGNNRNAWYSRGAEKMKNFFDAARRAITTEGSLWGKLFNGLSKVLRWMGALVSAGFAVLATMKFIEDLLDGSPATIIDKAFDGIMAACAILETVCLIVELIIASTVAAVLAAVFAVVGLIFALVLAFLPKPQPESPVDKFMDNTLRPFVEKLTPPPADWQPPSMVVAVSW